MFKLGLHKRVLILTLMNENSKNTPEPPPQPIVCPTTNMSHILQQSPPWRIFTPPLGDKKHSL